MKTFYFNTGVRPGASPLYGNQIWRNGTKQIPFGVSDNIPDNASLMFLCSNPNLPESKIPSVVVEPVFNTDMCSKYAYFKVFK
jgi:hypothetical protein